MTVTTNDITTSYAEDGLKWMLVYGCIKRGDTYIPNYSDYSNSVDQIDDDKQVDPSDFVNESDLMIDFSNEITDTTTLSLPQYAFFDKTNSEIWQNLLAKYLDAANPYKFHSSEIVQSSLYENVKDAYKYQLWSKNDGEFHDIFLYTSPLSGADLCKAKKYVNLGEEYDTATSTITPCNIDVAI